MAVVGLIMCEYGYVYETVSPTLHPGIDSGIDLCIRNNAKFVSPINKNINDDEGKRILHIFSEEQGIIYTWIAAGDRYLDFGGFWFKVGE